MDFKERIAIYYTQFSPSERKVCAKILENPDIVSHNIVELGEICETSKSAILRFCKKLGYDGYSQFKYAVEKSSESQKEQEPQNNGLLLTLTSSVTQTLNALGKLNYDAELISLAQKIHDYTHVLAIGIDNSYFPARQLEYSLYSHDCFIQSINEPIQLSFLLNAIDENYLCIIYSVSGSVYTYSQFIKEATKKGAHIVLLTMNNDSKLIPLCSQSFVLPSLSTPLASLENLTQIDNRMTLFFFSEVISSYYGKYNKVKK